MGIDYSGGMVVGARASDIKWDYDTILEDYSNCLDADEEFEDLDSYGIGIEVLGLDTYSEYFDADESNQYWGYSVPDVEVNSVGFEEWLRIVKEAATKFERYTKNKAILIGTQDIY